jgi:hypothetical protein
MRTQAEVYSALNLLCSLADDLPDGMGAELLELRREFREAGRAAPMQAYEVEAWVDCLEDICADYGYVAPLAPAVAVLTPEGPGRLEP